ncbi:M23 family metallopeptidase [Pseudoalteromonas sp. MMG022]|uniref:M23 family metallopeptidase n=1 Tax=Pseudoalteromonas sp. MMG022 TaxID=2909978 RepID=UPI001F1AA4A6|nr:M23 family metallopeptidase [Pseudoalteromonas sp. MMG022]MCF6433993.1 M23 family metallopeptidase [Pseudoalteromonas sp. MMG022]
MLKKGIVIALSFLTALNVSALELKGSLTQGGMVVGKIADAKQVTFNDKPLKLTGEGEFVFGFGRDAQATHTLSWVDNNNAQHTKELVITEREFKIDRITGVEKKYVSPPNSVLKRIREEAKAVREARATESTLEYFKDPVFRPAPGRISGVYGSQRYFNGKPRNPHYGLDIANKTGTPVLAPLPGVVTFADPDLYYSGGTVIVDHGYGISSTYIHLSKLHVKVGDKLDTGDHFADIGATGRVTGPHLDWRFNWFNERLDPQLLMQDTLASKSSK